MRMLSSESFYVFFFFSNFLLTDSLGNTLYDWPLPSRVYRTEYLWDLVLSRAFLKSMIQSSTFQNIFEEVEFQLLDLFFKQIRTNFIE